MDEEKSGHELKETLRGLRQYLTYLDDCGLEEVHVESAPLPPKRQHTAPGPSPEALDVTPGSGGAGLAEIRRGLGDCRRCRLHEGRNNIVFGVGNPEAELLFVGEGPGRDEDLQGEPFVGRAGELLTKIITDGMGLSRADVYIGNVVKCRPPGNRDPEPDEVATCLPFLEKQIEVVSPRVIVALGRPAAGALLGERVPISAVRGRWQDYRGIRLMPTYHPAFLLRNYTIENRKAVWSDIQKVMEALGLGAW